MEIKCIILICGILRSTNAQAGLFGRINSNIIRRTLNTVSPILSTDAISGIIGELGRNVLLPTYNVKTTRLPTRDEYDFIVVGAGTAGSTVANRLSENSNWKILLLEAGKQETLINEIPVLFAFPHQTEYNWGYKIERQENACFGMTDGLCTWPRGKALGGTSSINAMIHTRGNKLDYDLWASMGNKEWSFEKVLPYFIKSENFKIKEPYNTSYHGHSGYVNVEDVPYRTPLATAYLEAGKELGYDIVDCNGPQQKGFSYLQVNMKHGTRCSAARAYLRVKRSNLDIVTGAFVTKILINDTKHAYGVEYIKNGVTRSVKASKEVISSAGTIDSAKLLMLSGIGPRDHLEKLGINVIRDAKVGYNLYEHIAFWGLVFTVNASVSINFRQLVSPLNAIKYARTRNSPISTPVGAESIAFIKTKYATDDRPDMELLFLSGAVSSDLGLSIKPSYGISDEVYKKFFKPLESKYAWTVWPVLQHPKSYGRVTLRTKDPLIAPILQPNFFTHPKDLETILEGIKLTIALSKTEPLRKFNSKLHDIKMPGCESYELGSDDYFRCAVKVLPALENHEIGTAKMGPESDPDAVVDPELRVYGIEGLRVIDASIMPTMPNGHINAGVYMIGEKGADIIKHAWKNV